MSKESNKVRNPVINFMDAMKKMEKNEKKKYNAFVERIGIRSYDIPKQSKPYLFPDSKPLIEIECVCGHVFKEFESTDNRYVCPECNEILTIEQDEEEAISMDEADEDKAVGEIREV